VAAAVVAEGLVKRFGSTEALRGVDLEVARATVLGVLGPNGAGKTTTVRILTTLLKPDGGRALIDGVDVVAEPGRARALIGLTGQYAAVDERLTGLENLELVGRLFHLRPAEARRRGGELLERFDLVDAADRVVKGYSGGMRRRLDIAMSLIGRPSVLFLDEPTTGLDPMSRVALWDEVRRLNGEGTTVFLTTQYLEEADELAGRVAIIDGGRIVREGRPADLKEAVGDHTLVVTVPDELHALATDVLSGFGGARPGKAGALAIGLKGGPTAMSGVLRALEDAGVTVEHVELDAPSLDDVFADATGRRLEGAGAGAPAAEEPA